MKRIRTAEEINALNARVNALFEEHHITDATDRINLYVMATIFLYRDRLLPSDLTPLNILSDGKNLLRADADLDDCTIQIRKSDGTLFWFPICGTIVERFLQRDMLTKKSDDPRHPGYVFYHYTLGRSRIRRLARRFATEEKIGWDNVPDTF